MNRFILTLLSTLFLFLPVFILPLQDIEEAFQKGDGQMVMQVSAPKIMMQINGNQGVYSPSQGAQVLNAFFKENPPQSFSIRYSGDNNKVNAYAIGEYQSSNNKQFQVSLKFKKEGNNSLLVSLSISEKK